MARAPRRQQSRSWFGTLNNYTAEELEQVRAFDAPYVAIGFHIGEQSHLPHIHVLVQFKNPRGWPKLSTRFHWEKRRGTVQECLNYLNKNNQLEERGARPPEPKDIHEEWTQFVESIHNNEVDKDSKMYARYEGYAKRRLAELKPKKDYQGELDAKNIWICGPPGIGKSRMVRQTFSAKQIYNKGLNKWWDAYQDEECVLIEDIDPKSAEFLAHHMKIWADRYSFGAEVKNGRIQVNPLYHLVVTSQYTIQECFPGRDNDALRRRFDTLDLY